MAAETGGPGEMADETGGPGEMAARRDVQFIFSGNESPYSTYAKYNKILGRPVITEDVLSTLEARFHIVCLDGEDREQRVKYLDISLLTDEEYIGAWSSAYSKHLQQERGSETLWKRTSSRSNCREPIHRTKEYKFPLSSTDPARMHHLQCMQQVPQLLRTRPTRHAAI